MYRRWPAQVFSSLICALGYMMAACDRQGPSSASETGCGCTTVVPRWVLRDKDGERVDALVEPRCGTAACPPLELGVMSKSAPCVRVITHGDRYVNLLFSLDAGDVGVCMHNAQDPLSDLSRSWKEAGAFFTNAQCAGQAFGHPITSAELEGAQGRALFFAENDMWYLAAAGCVKGPRWVFDFVDTKACVEVVGDELICPFERIPQWAKSLLDRSPYTLAVESE